MPQARVSAKSAAPIETIEIKSQDAAGNAAQDAIHAPPPETPSSGRGAYLIAAGGLFLLTLLIATNMNC